MWAMLSGVLAQGLLSSAARMLALKVFMRALLILIIPLLTLMAFNSLYGVLVDYVVEEINNIDVGNAGGYSFPGMFLYIYGAVGLDSAIIILFSALSTKLLLRSIPFVRL
jgi:hypothetical protein